MKKIFVLQFIGLLLFSCSSNNDVDEFTIEQTIKEDSNNFNYQYDIRLRDNNVDIRTFMYHGHEYIVGVSYLGSGGGIDIEHSASCTNCPNKTHLKDK